MFLPMWLARRARPFAVIAVSFAMMAFWLLLLPQARASVQTTESVEPAAIGNLNVSKYSLSEFGGVLAGSPISYTIFYRWDGDGPAPNVQLQDLLPAEVAVSTITPPPTTQSGRTLTWNLGTLDPGAGGIIQVEGTVGAGLSEGTRFTNTVTISGDVTDEDTTDNSAQAGVRVVLPRPSLFVWKFGLFEELDAGSGWTAELGVPTTFNLYYFNFSFFEAPSTTLTDTLPTGLQFISAEPAPILVSGQQLRWDLGTLPPFGFGEVQVRARPTVSGTLINRAGVRSTMAEENEEDNLAEFSFDVVPLLQPRLLKPKSKTSSLEEPLIVGPGITFEGLAKAGATVTLYEGNADGCFGEPTGCNLVPLGSAVAGPDRRWMITPTVPLAARAYHIYLRAELGSQKSSPAFSFWEPLHLLVDPRFEQAGWDMDNFVIESGPQETRPGGVGGSSGTTPDQPIRINIRQKAPNSIQTDPTIQRHHNLLFVRVDGDARVTETVPFSEVRRVPTVQREAQASPNEHFSSWDFIYVHKGFGPGSVIEIWCLPVFYTEDGIPIVGLVYVKCHVILVDPAGYVYDIDKAGSTYEWPNIPPSESLITNATVTTTVRVGDDSWVRWAAEETGQVNPQFTDASPADRIAAPGYFAFYVPSGQYRVEATAPHCLAYTSPTLTVVEEPVFHNVGMRCTAESQAGVNYPLFLPVVRR